MKDTCNAFVLGMCSWTSPGLTLTLQVSTLYVTLCVQTMRVATYQIILGLVTQLSYSMLLRSLEETEMWWDWVTKPQAEKNGPFPSTATWLPGKHIRRWQYNIISTVRLWGVSLTKSSLSGCNAWGLYEFINLKDERNIMKYINSDKSIMK